VINFLLILLSVFSFLAQGFIYDLTVEVIQAPNWSTMPAGAEYGYRFEVYWQSTSHQDMIVSIEDQERVSIESIEVDRIWGPEQIPILECAGLAGDRTCQVPWLSNVPLIVTVLARAGPCRSASFTLRVTQGETTVASRQSVAVSPARCSVYFPTLIR
jgi:hypothetical protein